MKTTTALMPLLAVRDGARTIEFYKGAFGATLLFSTSPESVSIVAQMAIEEATFWLADESPANENFSPESLGGSTVRLVLVVGDPDAVFAQAVLFGATLVWPVEDQPYGWRMGRVADPFGHHGEIGRPL